MENNFDRIKVLDYGYVKLVDSMGTDDDLVSTARVSYGITDIYEDDEANTRLMHYLISNGHESPLEQLVLKFEVKAPIFVERHYVRHRMSSTNEQSMRTKGYELDYYIPEIERIMNGNTYGKNKSENTMTKEEAVWAQQCIAKSIGEQDGTYKALIAEGVPYELARTILPLSAYTKKVWTINLRSLTNVLRQRLGEHAQYETQEYAKAFAKVFENVFPKIYKLVDNYIVQSTTFSKGQMGMIKALVDDDIISENYDRLLNVQNHKKAIDDLVTKLDKK